MSKYIKLFDNHTQYETFMGSDELILPNVSHCIEENEVHYNPYYEVISISGFSVTFTSVTVTLEKELPQGATDVSLMDRDKNETEWYEIGSVSPSTDDGIVWKFNRTDGDEFSPSSFNCRYVKLKYILNGNTCYTSEYKCSCFN